MKRRCSGCGQRKECDYAAAGNVLYCDGCARSWGIAGGKPRNQSEAGHKRWLAVPCKHRSGVKVSRYKQGGKWHVRGNCNRCRMMVWDILDAS